MSYGSRRCGGAVDNLGGSGSGKEVRDAVQLLTKELLRTIPPLYSQEHEAAPLWHAKFFLPDGTFTWYVIEASTREKTGCGWGVNCQHRPLSEYDPKQDDVLVFGYVIWPEAELGYFSLSGLTCDQGWLGGLPVQRDRHFIPRRLSAVKAAEGEQPYNRTKVPQPGAGRR